MKLIKKYQEWIDERRWQKEYGESRPDWVKNEEPVEKIINSKIFREWLSKRTPEQQLIWLQKIEIVNSGLDKLLLALDNEIIKRGGEPHIDIITDTTKGNSQ